MICDDKILVKKSYSHLQGASGRTLSSNFVDTFYGGIFMVVYYMCLGKSDEQESGQVGSR